MQTGETGAMKTAFNAEESAIPAIQEWIENYCESVDPNMAYRSRETFAAEFEGVQNMYLTVGGLLSFILALIGILNFINSVITSVQTRRQELAVLQSVGMTGKQLKKMLIGEGLWYTAITVLITLTIGSLITYGWLGDRISDVVLLLSFYNHTDPAVHTCSCGAVGTYPGALLSEYV